MPVVIVRRVVRLVLWMASKLFNKLCTSTFGASVLAIRFDNSFFYGYNMFILFHGLVSFKMNQLERSTLLRSNCLRSLLHIYNKRVIVPHSLINNVRHGTIFDYLQFLNFLYCVFLQCYWCHWTPHNFLHILSITCITPVVKVIAALLPT